MKIKNGYITIQIYRILILSVILYIISYAFFDSVLAAVLLQSHNTSENGHLSENNEEFMQRYRIIIEKNLFMPLGTDLEVKNTVIDFNKPVLILMYDDGQKKSLLTNQETSISQYVSEGENLESGTQVVEISEKSVKLSKEGHEITKNMDSAYMSSFYAPYQNKYSSEQQGRDGIPKSDENNILPIERFKPGTNEWREALKKRKLMELGIYME